MKNILWLCLACLFAGSMEETFAQSLPIKATRTVAFTTTEGSNMDVDVSPDGKTLIFDLLGDLYTVPISGGTTFQLTRGLAINWCPVWSPDGKRLAYYSDQSGSQHLNILNTINHSHWVIDGNAPESWEINPGNYNILFPVWTPDGRYVWAGKGFLFGLTGGKLAMQFPYNMQPLGFSRKADTVYVAGFDSMPVSIMRALSPYDPGCKKIDTIYKHSAGFRQMALSPNKRWFTYIADSNGMRSLYIADLVHHSERILLQKIAVHLIKQVPRFAFSPDSKYIYVGFLGKIHRVTAETGEDKIIPMVIHVKSDLGPFNYNTFRVSTGPFKVKYTRSANASPNGKKLVFSALNKVYIMDMPKGKPHLLCWQPFNQFQPTWSPDGKQVAFVSWCDTTGGYLWSVSSSGGKPVKLTAIAGQYQHPVFSPDGDYIAVLKNNQWDDYEGTLQLLDLKAKTLNTVADSILMNNLLAFSGDSKRIIFENICADNWIVLPQLVSCGLDGKNQKTVALGRPGIDAIWFQRSESPDGRFFVYSRGEDMYLVPVQGILSPPQLYNADGHLQTIRFAKGMDPHWEQEGKVLSWSYGNQFYRVSPEKIMETAENEMAHHNLSDTISNHFLTAYVKPDEIVDLNITALGSFGKGTIVLKNARILTMKGNQVIDRGTIVIRNGRIATLATTGHVQLPAHAKIIDLRGKTIMPGFVDLHMHQGDAADIFPQQYWVYLASLAYGMTTMRDPAVNYDSFGYTELLETGQMIGPRLYSSGEPVRPYEGIVEGNYDDFLSTVEKRKLLGGTFMKNYLVNGETRLQRQWLAIASRKEHLNMTNEGYYPVLMQLTQLKDGSSGIEHNPDWGDTYKDVITLYARSGTFLTPTILIRAHKINDYMNFHYWQKPDAKVIRFLPQDNRQDLLKPEPSESDSELFHPAIVDAEIRRAGGKVTLGSHSVNQAISVHKELWALQKGGLTNMQALQAATIMAAQGLGIQKDVGSIEAGKIADLVILNSDPLNDIHNSRDIKYVMKAGILYNAGNMDELWPVYKKCPEWKLKGSNPDATMLPAKVNGQNSQRKGRDDDDDK